MFWLPRKTIYTGPRKQRGNIVFRTGQPPTAFTDPSTWTLIQSWDSRDGDMADIVTAMSTNFGFRGFAWSYDGTKYTHLNAGDAKIYTFTCSTPFDPETTGVSITAERAGTVPTSLQYSDDGLYGYKLAPNHESIVVFDCPAPFVVGADAATSSVSKGAAGFSGIWEGDFSIGMDGTTVLYHGVINGGADEVIKQLFLSIQHDLSSFAVNDTVSNNPPVNLATPNAGESVLSLDNSSFYQCHQPNIYLAIMSSTADLSTLTYNAAFNIRGDNGFTWDPVRVWINPNDTEFAWIGGTVSGWQLAKFATNV